MTTKVTALETVELRDDAAGTRVWLAPSRGGMVTRFSVAGRPVLYIDDATLLDEKKNVRGGNPVLFPSPGPLAGDRFTWRGRSGSMKQHGFARTRPWRVAESSANRAVLELASDDVTRAQFPFDFVLRYGHVLEGARLRIEQHIENTGDEAMPFAVGFHPYFFVPDGDKARTRIPTAATRAWDNVAKREVALTGSNGSIDLAGKEVDLHLVDHGATHASLDLARTDLARRVIVRGSDEYGRWVIWTLPGKDFVCLEPWTSAADALNAPRTGVEPIVVPPRAARELFVEIEVAGASSHA